jgi:hypothetical protein
MLGGDTTGEPFIEFHQENKLAFRPDPVTING